MFQPVHSILSLVCTTHMHVGVYVACKLASIKWNIVEEDILSQVKNERNW